MNSGTLVDRQLEAGRGDKVAIRCAGEETTYAQLHANVCRAGGALRELGVGREDRVLMILDDTPTFPALFLGAMRMGAVPAPVSFLDTTENFRHYASDSYARVVVAEDALLERLPPGAIGRTQFEALMADAAADTSPADTHADDMAFWLFSGGSTGFPKGVVHLHHDIPFTVDTYAREILGISERDVTFSSTKLYHAYGLGNNLTFPYSVGATTVLRPGKPDPRGLLETAAANRPSLFFSVPTLYGAMVNLPDASSIRPVVGALLRERRRAARARGPAALAGLLRPRHRRRHRLDRDAAHLLLQPAGRRAAGDLRQARPGVRARAARRVRPAGRRRRGRQPARARRQRARVLLAPAREDQGGDQGPVVLHRRSLPGERATATTCTRAAPTT